MVGSGIPGWVWCINLFLETDIKTEIKTDLKVESDLPLKLSLVGSIADENDSATGTALEGEISDKSDKSDKDQSDQDEIEEIHFDQPIITSNGLNKLLHVSSNCYSA